MTLVHDPIDSLIGGVSQQAAALRFKSQAETIENCWLSAIEGLVPRSHTRHRSKLIDGKAGYFFSHGIDRDRLERYVMLTRQQELLVHDLDGNQLPVRWDGRQLLKAPDSWTGGFWTVTGGGLAAAADTGSNNPLGTSARCIDFTIDTGTGAQTIESDIGVITSGTNPRTITSGRQYIAWMWLKPDANVEKTRLQIEGQSSGRGTLVNIDWTKTPIPEITLFTPLGDGRHDHGAIMRADGWWIVWVVFTWDIADDANGMTLTLTPDLNNVASTRHLFAYETMVEEWEPTLEGPGLIWADAMASNVSSPSTHTDYFDFRQTNPVVDPETFDTTAGWTAGSQAATPVVSAHANPFAFAAGNKFYYKLAHDGAGVTTDGAYFQTVGTIYPSAQVLLCYFRKEDATAGVIMRLNLRDTVGGQSSVVDFEWSGTALVSKDNAAGAVLDHGVVQSPFDDEDWMAWIAVHPDEHASVTAGNARDAYVYVFTDPVSAAFTYAWGALVLDGEKAGKFLDYVNPLRRARALTIADSTFPVNPSVKVDKIALKTPEDPTEDRVLFWVKTGGFNQEYAITVRYTDGTSETFYTTTWDDTTQVAKCVGGWGDTSAECSTSGGTWQAAVDDLKSSEQQDIAARLSDLLDASADLIAQSINASIEVVIAPASSRKIQQVEVEDSQGGNGLIALWRDVEQVQDLPKDFRDQWRMRVVGEVDGGPAYYVMFIVDGESGSLGTGRWVESTYWDTEDFLDPSTLPHQIVRRQDDATGERTGTAQQIYFEIRFAPWRRRLVGDDDTNPFPALVSTDTFDRFVSEVFFVQSRLGFLSDENLVLSEVDRFFNLFRSTVIDVNDADAIGANASHTKVSILEHAIVIDERMLVSSDRSQLIVEGTPILSSKTIQVIPKTNRELLRRPRMVASGRGVFAGFPVRADADDTFEFSGVLEFLPSAQGGQELQVEDVTSAVPAYIAGELEMMSSNASVGLLLVATDGGRCFTFKFHESGGQVVQQAWGEWIFGSDRIEHVGFSQTEGVFLIRREEGLFLETMRIGENLTDDGVAFLVRLDRRVDQDDCTFAYDETEDETTVTLPYNIRTGATMVAVNQATLKDYPTISATALGASLVVQGDISSTDVWIGETYAAKYVFSTPFMRTQDSDRAVRKLASGQTTILNGKLVYAGSAAFDVVITHTHGDTYTDAWNSFVIGTPDADFDAIALLDGDHEFGIGAFPEEVSIEIRSKSYLPFQILEAVWEGNYAPRSGRVTA